MAIVVSVAVGSLAVLQLAAQSGAPDASNPTFEVASIKANKSGSNMIGLGAAPGSDRFTASNVTLRLLIRTSYQLQDSQIVGGPDWINSDRFDIVAKAERPPTPVPPGQVGPFQLMMRSLLADRFKLAMHAEMRELPIYALVMARNDGKPGPQLKPAAADCAAVAGARGRGGAPPAPPAFGERPACGMRIGPGSIAAGGSSMVQFANNLSTSVGRIVVDRTGLAGNFDIDLQWTPDQMPQMPAGGPPPGAPPLPPIDPNGPSIFTAVQEQLGLKLESSRGPVNVMVIDRVERPTED